MKESDEILLDFGGVAYYIDFNGLENLLRSGDPELEAKTLRETETETTNLVGGVEKVVTTIKERHKPREVDISKYETYNHLLDILMAFEYTADSDEDYLGVEGTLKKTPLPFKIAFNTLVHYGVLKTL
jgi:hypothetical protein